MFKQLTVSDFTESAVDWVGEKPSPCFFWQINNHFAFNGPLLNMGELCADIHI